jgi:hypothetical protein
VKQHKQDLITDPSHYQGAGGMESIEAIEGMLGDNITAFYRANILKYLWRYEKKGGLQDLRKCQQYISLLLDKETAMELRDRGIDISKLMNQTGAIK